MQFILTINCDNDAFTGEFGDEHRTEVSDILSKVAFALVTNDREAGNIMDSNGNFVGSWHFNDDEENDE